ncbi:MAG: glycosyltransferase, partial [Candidatus Promineifilaceae bacterium]
MMRLLHTVPYLIPEAGGPARSVPNLCTALAQQGHQVDLVSCDYGDQFARPLLPPTSVKTQLVPIGLRLGLGSLWEPQLNRRLTTTVAEQGVQLIHNHVLWLPFNYVSVRAARRNNLPHIISTRGMVSRWAMSQSRLKKQLAWRLFQNRDLQTAAFLHTTSED